MPLLHGLERHTPFRDFWIVPKGTEIGLDTLLYMLCFAFGVAAFCYGVNGIASERRGVLLGISLEQLSFYTVNFLAELFDCI